MLIFASFFEFCLFFVLLREYLATYYPNFLISCSYECLRAFSFFEIQLKKYIALGQQKKEIKPINQCSFEFLLVEHEQENGEFLKIELPKSTFSEGNVLDNNFFNKLIDVNAKDKYKIRILDQNVNYLHINPTHKILLFKDYYLLEVSNDEQNQTREKNQTQEENQKEDSDGFEEFTDMNFH
jgi:hypothetical protein